MGPWDPNWRPDPSGRRLQVIRTARWGALLSAFIFGLLVIVATALAPPVAEAFPDARLAAGIDVALFSLPALALLGAALTPAALGTRTSAASAALAIGVGVPVAAVTSAMIGVFILGELAGHPGQGSEFAGRFLRAGVTAAVGIAPLIALGSVGWVVLVRRLGRTALANAFVESGPAVESAVVESAAAAEDPASDADVRPGRGPHPPPG